MRVASYRAGKETSWGVVVGDHVSDASRLNGSPHTVRDLLESADFARWLDALADPSARTFPLADVQLLAPLEPRQDLIALGLNYTTHAAEAAGPTQQAVLPKQPILFGKAATSVIGPDAEIRIDPKVTTQVDWEVELAVVIGRRGHDIPADRAIDYVFGYMVANDVSARDLQFLDGGQWYRGKSLDTFCPLGPWIVTTDELGDARGLRLTLRVNGVTKQDASTDDLIFAIPEIIASASSGRTLYPGDVILTGTPGGVGFSRKPPEFLHAGDVVDAEIAKIGVLRNRVVEPTAWFARMRGRDYDRAGLGIQGRNFMRHLRSRFTFAAVASLLVSLFPGTPVAAGDVHAHIDCGRSRSLCAEVDDLESFSSYVGHDEPSLLFYSNEPGSGNQMQYVLTLPSDPVAPTGVPTAAQSFNFELHPAFWFGMAICDTQSSPRPLGDPANPINPGLTCTPDSDTNIHENPNPAASDAMATHPGTAFMEMQFYPPGWTSWPAGVSCDANLWCAALNIDSLEIDYFHGTQLNKACQNTVSIEPVNFAFITKTGVPHAPPSPVNSTASTFTPNAATDLFMNSGDRIVVTMQDTTHGLRIDLNDLTTGQSGFMTASATNGFGQVQFEPKGSVCKNLPYDFHPEYSTSSELTRVPWAAHSYNIAFSDEIGHFDFCGHVTASGGCNGTEGATGDLEKSDKDDNFCMDASASLLIKVSGCLDTNSGFDGSSYLNVWPDGSADHPTPIVFTSALTGAAFNVNYSRIAFEADLPRIEAADVSPVNSCNRNTGERCVKPPLTDDGVPADFYPFFSTATGYGAACAWAFGNDIPGHTVNDFGKLDQYGSLLRLTYPLFGGLGATSSRFNDFRQIITNPCTP